jgi:hypothetical protein
MWTTLVDLLVEEFAHRTPEPDILFDLLCGRTASRSVPRCWMCSLTQVRHLLRRCDIVDDEDFVLRT